MFENRVVDKILQLFSGTPPSFMNVSYVSFGGMKSLFSNLLFFLNFVVQLFTSFLSCDVDRTDSFSLDQASF